MKILRRAILVVVLLVVVVLAIVYFSLDRIIKTAVQRQSTQALNLQTTLGAANLSLFGGKLDLNQLQIASPAGYAAPHMLELGATNLAVSYGQLRNNPIHVQSLTLDSPKLVIEQKDGVLNFKKAMDGMPPGDSSTSGEPSTKLVIDTLTLQNAQVVIHPGSLVPGMPPEINVPIPSLTMKNIGTGDGAQNGAALKDVVMQVVTAMAGSASQSGGLPDQLKGLLQTNVAAAVGQLGAEARKRVAGLLPGDFGKAMSGAINDPQSLIRNPGQALQGAAGLLGGHSGGPSSPNTQPKDTRDQAIDAVQGLFGSGKK